ncbi:MAG: hypothetical protein A2V66_11470 [Ignavibacteria bacterium RBG_13_36_8]|nr:MAG: hypothetical protein A2V66_11470 [Ignavibacteria bacterium RBG_13_36_8]
MGTTYSVKVVKDPAIEDLSYEDLKSHIDSVLILVNEQMSTYIDTSEISRFNKYRGDEWFKVSSNLVFVISKAIEISKKSNGAFDVTVGPIVNLWGFGPLKNIFNIPGGQEIEKAQRLVGYHRLSQRSIPPSLKKNLPDIYIDLSAIAKGFGVDKISEYLESRDIHNYLVEIGGEVRTKGKNHKDEDWKIGISTPDEEFGIEKVVELSEKSMATSGDYRNYFEKDGVRYSHTIDPRTGYPIKHKLASVTVIHDSCVVADAWATAIDVLGPEVGYELALKEKLPVFLIIREGNDFIDKMTPEFQEILKLSER